MGLSPTYCTIHGPSISPTRVSSAQGPCRVPATRPSGPTSRSNSPRYPRRGVLPHAGDCPTLTHPCRCPGSRRRRTPHDRTPRAGTAQKRTPSYVCEACPGNKVFRIWQAGARDSGSKIAASAHGMGAGGLAVDTMSIGCLGVERRVELFFSYLANFHAPRNFSVCTPYWQRFGF